VLNNPLNQRASQVMTVITVALLVMSAVNALLTTWATVLDARRSSALSRALGATSAQVSAGLAVAQMLPPRPPRPPRPRGQIHDQVYFAVYFAV
jgi:putative ABC transport system permease protein